MRTLVPEYVVVSAREPDLVALPAIERAAADLFSPDDLPLALRDSVTPLSELIAAERQGRVWVALSGDRPVGFAIADRLDEQAYLAEMDVLPAHTRHGIGTELVRRVCLWARAQGLTAVTLTTFRHVPWNGPFYSRLGFRTLPAQELTPGLAQRLRAQASRGLDPAQRVAMRLELDSVPAGAT